ncbi:MAG: TM2 domain-containing protein [Bacteroidales bacterium]|nr:TM2 domain-containing protein [Bacteroidales bacterium]
MEKNKIDFFIAQFGNKFPPEKLLYIQEQLAKIDDSKYSLICSLDYKEPSTLLIISILVGALGIDRFLLDDVTMGILKLLTCGGIGIWTIIDWFTVTQRTREYNFKKLSHCLQ